MKFSIFNLQFSILFLIIFLVSLLLPLLSLEAGLVPCGCVAWVVQKEGETVCCAEIKTGTDGKIECEKRGVPCQLCHFFVLFQNILNFLLWKIIPPLAALMIAIGGFCFIFGFAEEKAGLVNKGKDIIKTTLIGLVIIFAAWLVVNLFFQVIGVADWNRFGIDLEKWWKINCPTQ